jgi:hypothetical protein
MLHKENQAVTKIKFVAAFLLQGLFCQKVIAF